MRTSLVLILPFIAAVAIFATPQTCPAPNLMDYMSGKYSAEVQQQQEAARSLQLQNQQLELQNQLMQLQIEHLQGQGTAPAGGTTPLLGGPKAVFSPQAEGDLLRGRGNCAVDPQRCPPISPPLPSVPSSPAQPQHLSSPPSGFPWLPKGFKYSPWPDGKYHLVRVDKGGKVEDFGEVGR